MFTKTFWLATTERVIRTFCQALVACIGVGAFDIIHFAWSQSLSVSGGAAFLALLTCVVASLKGDSDSPSFSSAE